MSNVIADCERPDPDDGDFKLPDLSSWTDERLEAEFAKALKDTADGLLRLAAATAELERRGKDLSHLKLNLISYLRLIAARQLMPDVVLYLGDQKTKVMAIARLPIKDQQKLIASDKVTVLIEGEEHKVKLRELDSRYLRQVFGENSLRTVAEQRAFVRNSKTTEHPIEEPRRAVKIDLKKRLMKLGNNAAPIREVVSAIAEAAGPLEPLDINQPHETITVRVTAKEKQAMKTAEKRRGLPEWHLAREAIHANGLI